VIMQQRLNPAGEVFELWFECSECETHVELADRYCRHCGVKFWSPKP
jgi:predicted amidophosphoribosyltransferase